MFSVCVFDYLFWPDSSAIGAGGARSQSAEWQQAWDGSAGPVIAGRQRRARDSGTAARGP